VDWMRPLWLMESVAGQTAREQVGHRNAVCVGEGLRGRRVDVH
jgi:hypothetical protein